MSRELDTRPPSEPVTDPTDLATAHQKEHVLSHTPAQSGSSVQSTPTATKNQNQYQIPIQLKNQNQNQNQQQNRNPSINVVLPTNSLHVTVPSADKQLVNSPQLTGSYVSDISGSHESANIPCSSQRSEISSFHLNEAGRTPPVSPRPVSPPPGRSSISSGDQTTKPALSLTSSETVIDMQTPPIVKNNNNNIKNNNISNRKK